MLTLYLTIFLLVFFAVGYLLPRFSAYFLGPALLAATAIAFVGEPELLFGSGSMGSMLAWVGVVLACIGGIVLIATGLMRVWLQNRAEQPPSMADQSLSSGERGWWRLFNAAVGIVTLTAPLLPFGRITNQFAVAIIGNIGMSAWDVVQFLCTYLLPACVLFLGLWLSGIRQFASSNRGTLPILIGAAVIWLVYPGYIAAISMTGALRVYRLPIAYIVLYRTLIWSARAAISIGLLLRWQAHFRTHQAAGVLPDA